MIFLSFFMATDYNIPVGKLSQQEREEFVCMMKGRFPELPEELRVRMLAPPAGKVRMVLDTDTFNEIDDQFAVVYSLLASEKLEVQAFYAAPFFNDLSSGPADGMEKSYQELLRILSRMKVAPEGKVFRGSDRYLPAAQEAVDSPAARDLIERARKASAENPLYVVAIGAITNVASALLLAPEIIDRIVVVWLGGHALYWPHTKEFNLAQDLHASRVVLDSGVPLVLLPCAGVVDHLITTLPEINTYVRGKGEIGEFLAMRYEGCAKDHFAYSRVIWDISTVAWLCCPGGVSTELRHSPILTDQITWSEDASRHLIRVASSINRDRIFGDLFRRLEQYSKA